MTKGLLETTRVRLRALGRDDIDTLRKFINDPEVLELSNVFRPISPSQQEQWFEHATNDPNAVWFAIEELGHAPVLVGTCCLVGIDWIDRLAELRVRIGAKEAWGKSLGTEACTLLVRYAFDQLNLERIWLRVSQPNERALHLYEKLGFVIEGRLRRATYIQGTAYDVVLMGLLRDEWRAKPTSKPAKSRR